LRRYNLRREEDDLWLVVDGLNMETAKLGDLPVSRLCWAEAVEYVDLLNSLDAIERAAGRFALSSMSAAT
jgi:hypothetical protein